MKKILKVISIVVSVVILLVILGMILLTTVVSPNRFKPVLVEEVKKATGRELIVDGDLAWSFFPTLGLKAGHVALGNPAGFAQKTFAEFSHAVISVELLPLFKGNIKSSGILLKGMQLTLIKNKAGKTNWSFQLADNAAAQPTETDSNKNTAPDALNFSVSTLDVKDATLIWLDESTHTSAEIKNFEFHAEDINLTKPFLIATAFDFATTKATGHLALKSLIAFNLANQLYTLRDLKMNADVMQNNKKITLQLSGEVLADLVKQTLQWTDFKANVGNLDLTGNLRVSHLNSTPELNGSFILLPFDLKQLLQKLGQDTANLQKANDVEGNVKVTGTTADINIAGKVKIKELIAAKLTIQNIMIPFKFSYNVLNLTDITAQLYSGNLTADSQVKLGASAPQITLNAKLKGVQAEPLMKDLSGEQKLKIIGAGDVDLQVTTQGTSGDELVKNLNGTSNIHFQNGELAGIDLGYYVDTAGALLGTKATSVSNTQKTSFGNLTASAVIKSGVIQNNDLLLDSPRFTTNGKGTIDLVNQSIDYSLQVTVKDQDNALKKFSGIVIPALISGDLNNPKIRLDTQEIFKTKAKDELQKHKDEIQEKLKDKLPEAGKLLQNLLGQ